MKTLTACLSLLFALVLPLIVSAESWSLVLQGFEVAPMAVQSGEIINIDMRVKNIGNTTESFGVTVFCDDTVVAGQWISSLAPKDTCDLSFRLNTTNLSAGGHSIEVLTEKSSGQQKIHDCCEITVEEGTPSETAIETDSSSDTAFLSEVPVSLAYMLAPVSTVVAGVWLLRRRKSGDLKPMMSKEPSLHLFNEILRLEENVRVGAQDAVAQGQEYVR